MKIGVIGGGFYGCHMSKKFLDLGFEVDIYEKNQDILLDAISNNQHRLHLGYHYPRCEKTLKQCVRSYEMFLKEYPDCSFPVENNYYLVHKDSKISYDEYVEKYEKNNLHFEQISMKSIAHLIKNPEEISGVLKTQERIINLDKIKNTIRNQLGEYEKLNIFTNTNVFDVTEESVICSDEKKTKYDFVINCSYLSPDLGMPDKRISIKTENCMLVLIRMKNDKFLNKAITIVDGDFVSIYPADEKNTFTLSSVPYTPYQKKLEEKIENKEQIAKNIIKHCQKFVKIKESEFEIVKYYISRKAKVLKDKNAYRKAFYVKHNKNISIMSGKISAILDLQNDIIREVLINE